jgi:uncharacterized protein VirK/YbjX
VKTISCFGSGNEGGVQVEMAAIQSTTNHSASEMSVQLSVATKRSSVFPGPALKPLTHWREIYRAPYRCARFLKGCASKILKQFEILRIVSSPMLFGLVRRAPILPFKYLAKGYLARGLTVKERASCLAHHYRRLKAKVPASIVSQVLYRDITLLQRQTPNGLYKVILGFEGHAVREGELFLHLRVDGSTIFVLQFTVIPGWVVKSKVSDVLLISRLQGMKGCFPQIHQATKAFNDVAPSALLLSALQGIAEAYGVQEMAGVCATRQFSHCDEYAESFKRQYDDFWLDIGADRATDIFFSSPLPPREKPLMLVNNGHKARARKKRAFKQQIATEVSQLFVHAS